MDWKTIRIFCILILAAGCTQKGAKGPPELFKDEPSMRVLLSHGKTPPEISTGGAYHLITGGRIVQKGKALSPAKLTGRGQEIFLGGHKCADDEMYLKTLDDGKVKVNQREYYGDLHCTVKKAGELQVVNVVPMEKYVTCVLGGEMPLDLAQEAALEAQAIIARTYALYEKMHHEERDFDVYDTVQSQVYRGLEMETPYARAIVKKTRGIVILYQNAVFKTFFHSTCGGHTASAAQVFDYPDITPLSGRPCPFCTTSKYYTWQYLADVSDLELMLSKLKLASPFHGLAVTVQDRAGRVLAMEVHYGKGKKIALKASDVRSALEANKLRSTLFGIKAVENGILFEGRGWGHGVGMCQIGAMEMAKPSLTESGVTRAGFSAFDIIRFYYPASQIYRLWQ